MKALSLRMLILTLSATLILPAVVSTSAQEQIQFVFHKIAFQRQTVDLLRADGSTSPAEFLSEVILLPDGRAGGGFGLWEHSLPDGLALYRAVEGRVVNRLGPVYEFKARRLSPPSAAEITVTLHPAPGHPPEGTVRFFIDGLSSAGGQPLSFAARGRVHTQHSPTATPSDFVADSVFINAPPQTVVVETRTGTSTAVFATRAMVFPAVAAIGFAVLTNRPGIAPIDIRFTGGQMNFGDDDEFNWGLIHGRTQQKGPARPLPVLLVIANMDDASEPCRIYDILGWQGRIVHFEADTTITRLTFETR